MNQEHCLIITSIKSHEDKMLISFAEKCRQNNYGFILAGDLKSPGSFHLPGCDYLSLKEQKQLPFKLSNLLPDNSYAKKNLAYLMAIKKGYPVIIETDDDNLPTDEFWCQRSPLVDGEITGRAGWVNIYNYFSDKNIWPRGFSLKHIKLPAPALLEGKFLFCPVQQGLADENPDVDAIYRLALDLPFHFKRRAPVILEENNVCPFNSQNTTWFREVFPLLYLPSFCSFRMTDIWRSFVAQRILWTCDWKVSYHSSTVIQKRNEHDLLHDLEEEISGYLSNEQIVEDLCRLELKKGEQHIHENLLTCYKLLAHKKYIPDEELVLVKAWLHDLEVMKIS